ncbi:MAG: hypothetical protein IKK24_03770, partial [Clostridia bacterium]|nr:hypothetical protein [Clostridia bacterium]
RLKLPESFKDYIKIQSLILKIGVPAAISSGSYNMSIVFTNSYVALLGVEAVSARMYFSTILSYTYLFSIALGNANSIFVGRLCGAARYTHAEKINRFLAKITRVINLLISISVIILRIPLLSLFTQNQNIIAISLGVLLIDVIIEQARAVSHIYEYALRGAGDVMLNMVVMILSCWIFCVAGAYFFGMVLKMGLIGFWIGLALDESCRAVFSYFRWRTGKWKGILKQ